jgi:hypothetical protein
MTVKSHQPEVPMQVLVTGLSDPASIVIPELASLPNTGHVDVRDPTQPAWKIAHDWVTARLFRWGTLQSHPGRGAQPSGGES